MDELDESDEAARMQWHCDFLWPRCGRSLGCMLSVSAKEDVVSPFSAMTNKKTKTKDEQNEKARLTETHAITLLLQHATMPLGYVWKAS